MSYGSSFVAIFSAVIIGRKLTIKGGTNHEDEEKLETDRFGRKFSVDNLQHWTVIANHGFYFSKGVLLWIL